MKTQLSLVYASKPTQLNQSSCSHDSIQPTIISQSSKESPLLVYKSEAKSYPRGISEFWHMLALPGLFCLFLIQFPQTSLGSQPMPTAIPPAPRYLPWFPRLVQSSLLCLQSILYFSLWVLIIIFDIIIYLIKSFQLKYNCSNAEMMFGFAYHFISVVQNLAHSRSSINISWVDEWKTEGMNKWVGNSFIQKDQVSCNDVSSLQHLGPFDALACLDTQGTIFQTNSWGPQASGSPAKPSPAGLASLYFSSSVWFPSSSIASGSCWFSLIKAGGMASWVGNIFPEFSISSAQPTFHSEMGQIH